jgi:hypothetical protein
MESDFWFLPTSHYLSELVSYSLSHTSNLDNDNELSGTPLSARFDGWLRPGKLGYPIGYRKILIYKVVFTPTSLSIRVRALTSLPLELTSLGIANKWAAGREYDKRGVTTCP